MSSGLNVSRPVVPAVPLVPITTDGPSASQKSPLPPSPTKSATISLNPGAQKFDPTPPQQSPVLRAVAVDFVPGPMEANMQPPSRSHSPFDAIAEQVLTNVDNTKLVDYNEVESLESEPKDVVRDAVIEEEVRFATADQALILTCDTKAIPKTPKDKDFISKLPGATGCLNSVQLNILAGPRLPALHKVREWFKEIVGSHISNVQRVQVVIVRNGEILNGKYVLPDMDFEKFEPLKNFIAELLQTLSQRCTIIWGASACHGLAVQKYFHSKALPDMLEALKDQDDKGIRAYSETIDHDILMNIARQYGSLRGKKFPTKTSDQPQTSPPNPFMADGYPKHFSPGLPSCGGLTSISQHYERFNINSAAPSGTPQLKHNASSATSRSSEMNPNAMVFVPSYKPNTLFVPGEQYPPPHPEDPFHKQLVEVDTYSGGWNPPAGDSGYQYDEQHQYPVYYPEQMGTYPHPQMLDQQMPMHMPMQVAADNSMPMPMRPASGNRMHMPMQVALDNGMHMPMVQYQGPIPWHSNENQGGTDRGTCKVPGMQPDDATFDKGYGKKGKKGGYRHRRHSNAYYKQDQYQNRNSNINFHHQDGARYGYAYFESNLNPTANFTPNGSLQYNGEGPIYANGKGNGLNDNMDVHAYHGNMNGNASNGHMDGNGSYGTMNGNSGNSGTCRKKNKNNKKNKKQGAIAMTGPPADAMHPHATINGHQQFSGSEYDQLRHFTTRSNEEQYAMHNGNGNRNEQMNW